MDWFNKTKSPEEDEETPAAKIKDESMCVEEGCFEPKAPGQTYVCAKHIRAG